MRILPLNNITFKSSTNVRQASAEENKHTGLSNSAKLAAGIGLSAASAAALYFIFRKPPVKASIDYEKSFNLVNDTLSKLQSDVENKNSKLVAKLNNGWLKVQYSDSANATSDLRRDILIFDKLGDLRKRIVSTYDAETNKITHYSYQGRTNEIIRKPSDIPSDCLVKKVEIENFTEFNAYVPHGKQKSIYVWTDKNRRKAYMIYYNHNLKAHELNIYDENVTDDILFNHTKYDFAYNNDGTFAGYAKQSIINDRLDEEYNFNVYMKDGKKCESSYIDNLYDEDPRFNPKNF